MSYVGTVENGVVVLPPGAQLPEGTRVNVEPLPAVPAISKNPQTGSLASLAGIIDGPANLSDKRPIMEQLLDFAGMCEGLPEDMAENHDHYIHGTPKRSKQ